MKNSSIFNEVFGPVMVGPSSSHTAGPARIGKMCWQALPDEAAVIRISFDRLGSFAATYIAQGSNYGFIGGLMGVDIGDEQIKRSLIMARDQGLDFRFDIIDIEGDRHPNFALIDITTKSGFKLKAEAASTGGGMFEITGWQGRPVSMKGDCHEYLFLGDGVEKMAEAARSALEGGAVGFRLESAPGVLNVKADRRDEAAEKRLSAALGLEPVYLAPVLPVVKRMNVAPPFATAAEALEYAAGEGIDEPWRLAAIYEAALSGQSEAEVMRMMNGIASVMGRSARRGLEGDYKQRGFLPPQSPIMRRAIEEGRVPQVNLGVLNKAALWSCAVLDYDICLGVVAAAPTGGSSGVLPGAVISVGEDLGLDETAIAKALLIGGLVGVFIDHQATFAAEMAACQAEMGAASSMAAAAVVQLLGGSPEQAFRAAALALQNMLGLVCDPVAGVGNIPCVSRNASGAANALVSANMVLAGFDPYIPLDEVIGAMKSVGLMLPPELRCTGRGGLCLTETACRVCAGIDLTPSAG